MTELNRLNLQLFADGGEGGGDGGATSAAPAGEATPGVSSPDAGEARLRELGVPEAVLQKRANRKSSAKAPAASAQPAEPAAEGPSTEPVAAAPETAPTEEATTDAPTRMTWDEIMADPEYNQEMQRTMQARLKSAKNAEERLNKLSPAIELLARKYGLDADNLDADALASAISDDDDLYVDKALELGVSVETAKKIDQLERKNARDEADAARAEQQRAFDEHINDLKVQAAKLKQTFPTFDLATELRNPTFMRMTAPNSGLTVEDAYYAVHRKEIQAASMQVATQKTAEQMANAIRSGMSRPQENGTSARAPSTQTFDYAHASKEQREALKRQIRDAAAKGQKLYPGQR